MIITGRLDGVRSRPCNAAPRPAGEEQTVTTTEPPAAAAAAALIDAARRLAPAARAAAAESEAERGLPAPLVRAMREAGVFRMTMPRAWGGPEADPLTQLRVVEALSAADASAGWCAMIGSDGGYWTAFLDDAVGRELYPDLDAYTASSLEPGGRAVAVDGGYRVSGRWRYGSGCRHATWMVVTCVVPAGEAPGPAAPGGPARRMCFLPAAACAIIDTWTTTGLRGSGSHDYTVADVFVPAERTFRPFAAPVKRAGPLYALRVMFLANAAGVPLGVARGAVDALVELAATKPTPGGGVLRDDALVQAAVARAEALLGSARGYVFDAVGAVWDALRAGGAPSPGQRARFHLARAFAAQTCVEAVDLAYRTAGGTALFAPHPLDRALRDIHTLSQHVMFSAQAQQQAGRALLGLEVQSPVW